MNHTNTENEKITKISKILFEYIGSNLNLQDFFSFGNINKHYRALFLRSNKWRTVDLSFLGSRGVDWKIYKLCDTLNNHYQENTANNHQSPMIESLNLNGLYRLTEKCLTYLNQCVMMDDIQSLSIQNCSNLQSLLNFFNHKPRHIKSLSLPTLSQKSAFDLKPHLSSLTSLTTPGSIDRNLFSNYLSSSPNLKKISLSFRSEDNLFYHNVLEKLCSMKHLTHLYFFSMNIEDDDYRKMFLALDQLSIVHITNSFLLSGTTVNLLLDSCPQLTDLCIRYCRRIQDINVLSKKLEKFNAGYTQTCADINFPNIVELSLSNWNLSNFDQTIAKIFSQPYPKLIHLDLTGTKINDKSVTFIIEACPNLQRIDLNGNVDVTDEILPVIIKNCPNLYKVDFINTSSALVLKHSNP
ncbi:hypothetical protein CYY_001934 [Polysphondylium violaceum]|uniref:F-box domain-containing protein n=1 Tax=Polysphondylium violaceum TaxID=133409 RepID=A0A8J4Q086_9MYCE|nr:hypothetical protein CYY_001934 [Polysphondylium violaceum]